MIQVFFAKFIICKKYKFIYFNAIFHQEKQLGISQSNAEMRQRVREGPALLITRRLLLSISHSSYSLHSANLVYLSSGRTMDLGTVLVERCGSGVTGGSTWGRGSRGVFSLCLEFIYFAVQNIHR